MRQLSLEKEFSLAEERHLINCADLPARVEVSGKTVTAETLANTLRVVHSYGRECYASQQTMAAAMKCSERKVRRAIKALELLSLITVERKRLSPGKSGNHYRIAWTELALLLPEHRAASRSTSAHRDVRRSVRGQSQQPPPSDRPPPDQPALGGRLPPEPNRPPGTPNRPPGTPNRPLGTTQPAPRGPLEPPEVQEPPPSNQWEGVEEQLRMVGIKQAHSAVTAARGRGCTPQQAAEAIAEHQRAASLGQGALVFWMREGSWPGGRSRPPKQPLTPQQQAEDLYQRITRAGRRSGASEEAIRQAVEDELTARGLESFLVEVLGASR